MLAAVRAAPPGSRLFTADPLGGHPAVAAYGPPPGRCRGLATDLAVPQPAHQDLDGRTYPVALTRERPGPLHHQHLVVGQGRCRPYPVAAAPSARAN